MQRLQQGVLAHQLPLDAPEMHEGGVWSHDLRALPDLELKLLEIKGEFAER
jgi:hypothetical protein